MLSDTLARLQAILTTIIYPLWLLFGVIGCLLNILVFSRRKLRSATCSICESIDRSTISCCVKVSFFQLDFLAASIDHLVTLFIGIAPALYSVNHPDPQLHSLWFCKLRGYIFQISLMVSRWFVAFACIDRYVLSSDRVFVRNLATRKNTYRIIISIILFWSVICTHRLIFYETNGYLCGILSNVIAALYHSIYVIIGGGLCPSIIMIICAALINRNLFRKEQRRTQMSVRERRRNSVDQQVHRLLYSQVLFYIFLTTPQLCNLIFNAVSVTMVNPSNDYLAIQSFSNFIAELMLYLFPVTSFYLYTLTSRTFRQELWKCLKCFSFAKQRIGPVVRIVTLNNPS